jgi:hypothetical protein
MLRQLAPDLWVAERPLRFAGLEVGTRMSVIALEDGGLLLHSPIPPDPELREELDALGPVRFAVAPNRFHHLYVADCVSAYPELQCFCAPGLERKRSDIAWDGILGDEAPEAWAGQLDQICFRGFPLANEVLFLHRSSRTLLTADLVYNIGAESAAATRVFFRLLGGYGRLGPTRLERLLIRDRTAARGSLERILEWDFDRVILTHGEVLERGGPAALRAGYTWLLDRE